MSVYEQIPKIPEVNSFFGNLRNSNLDGIGHYEGFWGGLTDDNRAWMCVRNALNQGRWNKDNPLVDDKKKLEKVQYHIVIGRMEAGTGDVSLQLFVNNNLPVANGVITVNPKVNSSKMSIGQERDATNHPGAESFDGEITRFLIYERPLSDEQIKDVIEYLRLRYGLN